MTVQQKASSVIPMKKQKVFTGPQIILIIVVSLFSLSCIVPFINVIAVSLSSKSAILRGDVSFWPVEFTTQAYEVLFNDASMIRSLFMTVGMTVVYTVIAMFLTILMAYPLTKKRLRGRNFFSFLALFTMYFSGGVVPHYVNMLDLGLYNTIWSLILPAAISTYYMIILKSFFSSIPESLEEAATIDGANDFQILVRIYLPLSLASLATITLFYAVFRWNRFDDALYYIQDRNLYPLQLKLYNAIKNTQQVDLTAMQEGSTAVANNISQSIESATIIFATLPILVVYPFVQRYFVSGVTIGAVKG